ncbi:MAG: response regulator transcription factor [Hyphomicrobiales bacterium]|nr:response regulator transcription factor [Hyphomicrobiales bacterium]
MSRGCRVGAPLAKILVVEDDDSVRAVLRHAFEREGYQVAEADNAPDALSALDAGKIDLVTIDLLLKQGNGLQLVREIRARLDIPVVVITGVESADDRLTGLECGADDYIVKPFNLREVVLRIRNVLWRARAPRFVALSESSSRYAFGDCVLDMKKRELARDGSSVALTDLEFRLLAFMLENPARVLSREEISHALNLHNRAPQDRSIDTHIARLRRKLEPLGGEPTLIKSVRGVGYVFAGDVSSSRLSS